MNRRGFLAALSGLFCLPYENRAAFTGLNLSRSLSPKAKLQLITGGYVIGLKSIGLDWKQQVRLAMEEQIFHATKKA